MDNLPPHPLITPTIFILSLWALFLGGKATGHITWPWLWIFSPLWITAIALVAIALIMLVVVWFVDEEEPDESGR